MHVAKGNKTDEFYVYDLLADTLLQSRSPIPPGPSGKLPYDGSRGIGDRERYIYMTKGRRTDEFWQYDAATNEWSQLPDVPELPGGRKVTGCVDMAFVRQGDTGYIYLLEGKTCGFLKYNVVARTWQVMPGAPASVRPKYHEGSWLVYDGSLYVYAHRARYHELYRFNTLTATWDTTALRGMPFIGSLGRRKTSKAGGSADRLGDRILALKGGNTDEFWCYDRTTDSWAGRDAMPSEGTSGRKTRVRAGGDIVGFEAGGYSFALKGKSNEMWEYLERSDDDGQCLGPAGEQATTLDASLIVPVVTRGDVLVIIEHKSLWLPSLLRCANHSLLSADGRKTVSLHAGANDVGHLAAGVYFVHLDVPGFRSVKKVVMMR